MRINFLKILVITNIFAALIPPAANAYTANKVWFEFRPANIFRVYVNYTVPELKEYRESYVDFDKKKEAEKFYFDLVRGADFFPDDPKNNQFVKPKFEPEPW